MFFRKRKTDTTDTQIREESPVEPAIDRKALDTIKVLEEEAVIGKTTVLGDTIRISTVTDIEPFSISETVRRESYEVERIVRNEVVERVPEVRKENGVTIIPVLEERLVVTKQLFLREEIHLIPKHGIDTVKDEIELRKQRAIVERIAAE